ncbi:MAG: ABC transporter ATP-binding protein [Ignavibacteriales bacterium]|nr:MAG: ABC transporter ATP-binding protein [Ignavibacteriales bacterium]
MLEVNIKNIFLKLNKSEKLLLKDIEFFIEQNSVYTIIGKNGSGKSTIARLLISLLDKRFYTINARVQFENKNVLLFNEHELLEYRKHKVRCLFQDPVNSFDPLKKFKYYFDHFAPSNSNVEELFDYFRLDKPGKIFDKYPYEVSGGMAQRIAFILTLLSDAQILILDEPTSNIDAAVSNLLLIKLKEYISGHNKSVLLITQDLPFAEKLSTKTALLNNGSLTKFLSPHEFFEQTEHELVRLYNDIKGDK